MKIPFDLLLNYKPDEETEEKRLYSPPMPFNVGDDIFSTPVEVIIDYINLFLFLFFLGLSLYVTAL